MDNHSHVESEPEKRLIEAARREIRGPGGPEPNSDAEGAPSLAHVAEAGLPESVSEPTAGGEASAAASAEPSSDLDSSSYLRTEESSGLAADSIPGYSIVREIHRGGQGVVYQAIQKTTRRKVAIKVMREGPFASKHDKARFEREVQVLAALKHSNIVAIHDSGMAAGSFYFVMDYISGQPLDVYMAAGRHSVRETLALFQKICEAVNAAHLRGVIHRDLKPSNIRVDSDGQPQILDFGLAKVAPGQIGDESVSMTQTGQFVGSLPWASPEQAEAIPEKIDIRTDVYSLGVILYQMLTGKLPYDVVGSFREVLDRIVQAEPIRPRTLRHEMDDEVETMVLKCLAKDRDRRYQSAGELARDIGHYLAGEPVEAKRDSALYVMRKHLRHYKAPIAAGVLFVLLLAGFAISMSIQAQSNRRLARSESVAREQADRQRGLAQAAEIKATERARQLRRMLYANRIALAGHAFDTGHIGRAIDYLYSCPPDLRGWEWYRLVAATDQSRQTLRRCSALVTAVACSPDGKRIVSGGMDGSMRVWDAVTGRQVLFLQGHMTGADSYTSAEGICTVAFSADGRKILSGSQDKTLRIWDAIDSTELATLRGHDDTVRSAAFSPDSRRVLSGGEDKTVKVWDAATGTLMLTLSGHTEPVRAVAFASDGHRAASSSTDGEVKIWDTATWTEIRTTKSHHGSAESMAFSPENRWLASGRQDGTLKVSDTSTGEESSSVPGDGAAVRSVAFSPDAKKIVWGNADGALKFWDTTVAGAEPITLYGHEAAIQSVAWAPDGRQIVSGSLDRTVKIWEPSAHPHTVTLKGHEARVHTLAVSPNGKWIVSGSQDKTVRIWDAMTGSQIHTLSGHGEMVYSVAFSPDGKQIASASGDGTIGLWDSELGTRVQTLHGPKGAVCAVAFALDGRRIVSSHYFWEGGPERAVVSLEVWDAKTGANIKSIPTGVFALNFLAVSRDGDRLVTGAWDRTLTVWRAPTGEKIWTSPPQESPLSCVALSPDDGQVLSGSAEGILTLWNMQTGERKLTLSGNGNWVKAGFTPDGTRIVSGGYDGTVKIRDSSSGDELLTWHGHASGVGSIAVAPDASFVVSAGADRTLRISYAATKGQLEKDPEFASKMFHSAASLVSRGMLDEARPLVAEAVNIRLALLGQRTPDPPGAISDELLKLITGCEGVETPLDSYGHGLPRSVPFAEWDIRLFSWSQDRNLRKHEGKWEAMAAGASAERIKVRAIDFDWGHNAPSPNLPADYFGVLATTTVNSRAGVYWLRTISDDGVRVWIDDRRLIDNWTRHPATSDTALVALEDGEHRIRIEYCEIVLGARLYFGMWLLAPAYAR